MFLRGFNPGVLALAGIVMATLVTVMVFAKPADDDRVTVTHIQTSSDERRAALSQAENSDDPFSEGIGVNGAWTIDVSDPDGELVDRYVFNNSLVDSGAIQIADVLGRKLLPEYWEITIGSTESAKLPCESRGAPSICLITEGNLTAVNAVFNTLRLTVKEGVLILEGSATPERGGTIDLVTTLLAGTTCEGSFPDTCSSGDSARQTVTSTELRNGITVAAGQEIDVTVQLSFE